MGEKERERGKKLRKKEGKKEILKLSPIHLWNEERK